MEGGKPQITCNDEIFERGTFVGQRYRRMEDQKSWPGLPKIKSKNVKIGRSASEVVYSSVSQTGIWGGAPAAGGFWDVGAKAPKAARFLENQAISNAFGTHSGRVQSYLKELDF